MTAVLGINAVFHDPAAALVIDGQIVAACEEERLSRRKHGKPAVPFSTWELPAGAMRWCLEHAGIRDDELDAVAYSYDPSLAPSTDDVIAAMLDVAGWTQPWDTDSVHELGDAMARLEAEGSYGEVQR